MSSDRDGAGDGRDEGAGWQEPPHLGGRGSSDGWEPPGWSLPSAERGPAREEYDGPPPTAQPPAARLDDEQAVGRSSGDWTSAQEWATRQGWTLSDGTGPQDAVLQELVDSAPARRISKEHHPSGVMRGRAGSVELVAFDVRFVHKRISEVQYAITAAPVLIPLPRMRLSPARLWKHGTAGLLHLPSGDAEFDTRWVLLAEQDTPELRRLVADPTLRGLLLASDDGDEFWTAGGYLAAIRPFPHNASLIEHHARLLTAALGALAGV
jgi:hypothetical protein